MGGGTLSFEDVTVDGGELIKLPFSRGYAGRGSPWGRYETGKGDQIRPLLLACLNRRGPVVDMGNKSCLAAALNPVDDCPALEEDGSEYGEPAS